MQPERDESEAAAPLLVVRGLRKSFGPTVALAGVDLDAHRGEVHAVLGENGAGKSTLMNVLVGATAPDAGSITLDGQRYAPRSPREALGSGMAMVHQELSLCPELSVAANVMLGREETRLGFLDEAAMGRRARAALALAAGEARGKDFPLGARVKDLSPADRQIVEIARALADETCKVLILDEPTSSLGRPEVTVLFDRLRALKARGMTVLYISHFLEEVFGIADRYTVLRDGATVAAGEVGETTTAELVTKMAGRAVSELFARAAGEGHPGEVVLSCQDVAGTTRPARASFELRRGEIFGVAGLVGAGRTELLRVIFGLDPASKGTVTVRGDSGRASPRTRLAQGVGMLSEDRKGEGLALSLSIADNMTLSSLPFVVRRSEQERSAATWVDALALRCRDPGQPVRDLSGGNQQKVALGRLLHDDATVLLLDQPTRGIDVAAKADVYRVVRELASKGKAVVLVSDDLPELLGLADRIAVMHRGVLGPARPADAWTEESLLAEAVGIGAGTAPESPPGSEGGAEPARREAGPS